MEPPRYSLRRASWSAVAILDRTRTAPLVAKLQPGLMTNRADFDALCARIVAALNAEEG